MHRNDDKPGNDDKPAEVSTQLLDKIIHHSTLYDPDQTVQLGNILNAYNAGNKVDITVESVLLGKRIDVNEIRLVHRNNIPQLVPYTYYPRRLGIYMTGDTDEIGVFNKTDLCIGAHGRFLVNVPQGKLVKAWEGNTPIFLGFGPHVIRHDNFKLDKSPLVDLSDRVISHGNYHILRVPRGKIAKIWLGSTPYLLESRQEPYVIDDPTFMITFQTIDGKPEYFFNATDKLIVHGSIKRILPHTGEVAIAYDNGKLVTLPAGDKPVIVDSPTYIVDGFLKTNRQTLLFPSEETQDERRKKNPHDLDAISYETFRTRDGLPIGVNLLVVYEIADPQTVLEKLSKDEIKLTTREIQKHIENIVVAHMLSIIQSCSSADFQMTGQNAVKDDEKDRDDKDNILEIGSHASPFFAQMQKDTEKLKKDLANIGIALTQLRIEPPKILDKKIADEMAQNALVNAKARAEVSVLDLNYQIKQQQANQASEQQRIQMEREKQNRILQAQGEAEAIKIKAQAELDAAKTRADAVRIEFAARIENKTKENETEINNLKNRAQLFDEHPGLKEIEMTRIQAEALKGINSTIVSPDVVGNWFTTPGLGLFAGNRPLLPMMQQQMINQKSNNDPIPLPKPGAGK